MTVEDARARRAALAEAIREASRAGRLSGREELGAELAARGLPLPEGAGAAELDALLAGALAENGDLASVESASGESLYHAPPLLSRTYAAILARKGSPVLLVAGEVRTSSAEYPRPVPVELFEQPPFELSPEEIGEALKAMAASPDYSDITYTTTTGGSVWLFSTRHLERRYAAFLAQRAEEEALEGG